MKIILQIAKTELKTLFCSPIAWMILVVFAVQVGFAYTGVFEEILSRQLLGYWNFGLSRYLFVASNPPGVLTQVQNYLFIYIPLITMGVMHHERQTGSLSLLYSSPVAGWQIIVGKYLALLVVGASFVAILVCQGIYSYFVVEHFDVVYFIVAMLGVMLLIAAYAAIGLFMACVIRYPIAAAIATMALLLLLGYVGEWWQDVPVVNQIVYWLSVKNRLTPIIAGLLCSEDLFYFIIVSVLFVSLSIIYIYFSRRSVSWTRRAATYGTLVVAAVIAGYLTCQPRLMFYYDATQMKENSLIPEHQEIMKRLDGPLKITTYSNLLGRVNVTPTGILSDKKFSLANYVRFKPETQTDYVFYYNDPNVKDAYSLRQIARKAAIQADQDFSKFLSPSELSQQIDLSGEDYQFVRIIERGDGRKVTLRIFDDAAVYPSESEWMAAFKRLAMPLPRVGFLTGHGERSINSRQNRDLFFMAQQNNHRHALTNQGFDVVEKELSRDTLGDIQILMVADAQQSLSADEMSKLRNYIDRGGNLCLSVDETSVTAMRPLLRLLGVDVADSVITQPHEYEKPSLVISQVSTESVKADSLFWWMRKGNELIAMNGCKALRPLPGSDFTCVPLVLGTDSTLANGIQPADSLMLAVALTREINGKQQRIVVTGDADWMSNGELQGMRSDMRTSNANLLMGLFKWFSYGEVPISSGRKMGPDGKLTVNDESWHTITRILFWVVIPICLMLIGTVILIRRKRK